MKAIDIATRNHITFDDLVEVCKSVGIPCEKEDSDFSDQEVFLVEKKIEVLKVRKSQKAVSSAAKGKKIKLKRKVHVSKEIKDKHTADTQVKEEEPPVKKIQETVKEKQPEAVKPAETEKTPTEAKAPVERKPGERPARPDNRKPGERPARPDNRKPGERPARPDNRKPGERPARPDNRKPGERPARPDNRKPGERPARPDNRKPGERPARPDNRKPGERPARPDNRRPGERPARPDSRRSADDRLNKKVETPVAAEIDDTKKRKKDKDKDRGKDDRKKYKKTSVEEKSISFRKKYDHPQKKESTTPELITITEGVSVGEVAKKLNIKANVVIAKLMKLGVMATINQVVDAETVEILASEYGTEVKVVSLFDETVIQQEEEDKPEDYIMKPPVVTVMGHVDHGKTKLLDAIRKTDVMDHETGGITQHIGAYMVRVGDKKVTFLDTPGHAAFTTMRARGAGVTDIVILIVAANDGVMPQTIEAISHAKDAGVPIIVAINKIDLPEANTQKVRQELSNYELIPEEWGGTTLFCEISAKQGTNIEELLELVLIQTEMLELKANPKLNAKGTVIEAKLDTGRGPVSTILIQQGTLRVGDPFVVGIFSGKVRAMFNDQGEQIQEAPPSTPVEVLGITGVPGAGDPFECVASEKFAKQISQKRLEYKRIESAKKVRKVTLESLNDMIKEGEVQEVRIIVKADVDGSAQALTEALEKLSTSEVRVKVIHSGTGGINESDVMLASASNAIIIGYHVRPTGKVSEIAEKEHVAIKFYNIIFEATDDVKAAMEGMLSPEIKEQTTGTGEVRQLFKISKLGTIAGSLCLTGKIDKKAKMRLIRDGVVIFDGELKSLKRFKDDVNEVSAGQEFGFALEGYNDIKESDTFEAYKLIEIAKTL